MTDITTFASGHEHRNSRWARSRRRYNAGYGVKSLADMAQVLAFFEERRGRFHSFLWRDGMDFVSNPAGGDPAAIDQQIGVGDGIESDFQLVKRYGVSFDPYDRVISKPEAGSVATALDGVVQDPGDFNVDPLTGVVSFTVPPGAGVIVTAGFRFDVPVRFESDRLDVELTGFDAADVPNIPIIEVLE